MRKYFITVLILLLSLCFVFSQEELIPLNSNLNYKYSDLHFNNLKSEDYQNSKKNSSLQLPFLDDFYYASTSNYPNQSFWSDSSTYVNTGFPISPPSIGVATFDGLNKYGYPYTPYLNNLNQSLPADTLESKTINLNQLGLQIILPSDSVALSFYYQARGNGEPPESLDSLILDLYQPFKNKWISRVWFMKGNTNTNTNDTVFKRAFIPIIDTNYLKDGFKFRFRNSATTAGNFDHWNLDYVYLNKNRSAIADTLYNDITFGNIPSSFLKNYSSMPYEQYNETEMAKKNSVRIRNSGFTTVNMTYENKFYNQLGNQIHQYNGGADNLVTYRSSGYSSITAHSNPSFNYTFSPLQDSVDFKIKHYLYRSSGNSSDFIIQNDTVTQYQRFRNYYSFDDGSAEMGYFINGAGGKMAVKINLNVPDTFRGLKIYFDFDGLENPTQASSRKFRICVWSIVNGMPGSLILRDSSISMNYNLKNYNLFSEYKLTSPIILPSGSYFIGIQQQVASGINIGFDMNFDNHTSLFYNSGNGWNQSQQKGSLMLRPFFGKKIIKQQSIKQNSFFEEDDFLIYPNPSADELIIKTKTAKNFKVQLFNYDGSIVLDEKNRVTNIFEESFQKKISTLNLSNGVYYLSVTKNNNRIIYRKIIIQH